MKERKQREKRKGRGGVMGRGRRNVVMSHMYLNNNFRILHLKLCGIL